MSENQKYISTEKHIEHESNPYPMIQGFNCYGWICADCHKVNYISEDFYLSQKGVDECLECERAFNVVVAL